MGSQPHATLHVRVNLPLRRLVRAAHAKGAQIILLQVSPEDTGAGVRHFCFLPSPGMVRTSGQVGFHDLELSSQYSRYSENLMLLGHVLQELFEGLYFCQSQIWTNFERAKPREGHPTIAR